jgi:hypothetical protein
MAPRLGRTVLYWCCLVAVFVSEIAAIVILAAIITHRVSEQSEAWMSVWFFAVVGGVAWMVARLARASG